MSRSVENMVAEFHGMIGAPPWTGPIADMPPETLGVRNRLVDEETTELIEATDAGDLVGIADALADLAYVIYGTAYTYGIPLHRVIAAVHASNMTKDPGPDGKAVKGARYVPPDIARALAGPAEDPTKEPPMPTDHTSTLTLNDVQATVSITPDGKAVLDWTDYVAGDWAETFDTAALAYARLAALLACREAGWTRGFAHTTPEEFATSAREFLAAATT